MLMIISKIVQEPKQEKICILLVFKNDLKIDNLGLQVVRYRLFRLMLIFDETLHVD